MEPFVGALVAAGVAWVSIVAAALFPIPLDLGWLRRLGALSIAIVGVAALGAPLPGWLPLVVLGFGLLLAAIAPRVRRAREARRSTTAQTT